MSEQTAAYENVVSVPVIPCARGCNGRDILGHTAYCWRNQVIALREELARLQAAMPEASPAGGAG